MKLELHICHIIISVVILVTILLCYSRLCLYGHVREILDCLSYTDKGFLSQLISTVQLPYENGYDTQIIMKYAISTVDVILS